MLSDGSKEPLLFNAPTPNNEVSDFVLLSEFIFTLAYLISSFSKGNVQLIIILIISK